MADPTVLGTSITVLNDALNKMEEKLNQVTSYLLVKREVDEANPDTILEEVSRQGNSKYLSIKSVQELKNFVDEFGVFLNLLKDFIPAMGEELKRAPGKEKLEEKKEKEQKSILKEEVPIKPTPKPATASMSSADMQTHNLLKTVSNAISLLHNTIAELQKAQNLVGEGVGNLGPIIAWTIQDKVLSKLTGDLEGDSVFEALLEVKKLVKNAQNVLTSSYTDVIQIFDKGNDEADRFIVLIGEDAHAMSENATSDNGVNKYIGNRKGFDVKNTREVRFEDAPDQLKQAIIDKSKDLPDLTELTVGSQDSGPDKIVLAEVDGDNEITGPDEPVELDDWRQFEKTDLMKSYQYLTNILKTASEKEFIQEQLDQIASVIEEKEQLKV